MKLTLDREFSSMSRFLHQFVVRRLIREIAPYHPISLQGKMIVPGERGCGDRWNVIAHVLTQGARSVLDLGCAEGFFVSKAAQENGCFALGVDADTRRLTIAQEVNVTNRYERAGFMYAHITLDFLSKLPEFDVIIFLAMLHHMMYEHGADYAREIMRILRSRTKKALVFEMGQSNETSMSWAPLLPDMGTAPHEWIADFLRSCGFSKAVKAGETDAYQSDIRRAIFVAYP